MLDILTYQLGHMDNLVYIVIDTTAQSAAIVDPAWDVPLLCNVLHKHNLKLTAIWLTHEHFDHVEGVAELLEHHAVPIYQSAKSGYQPPPNSTLQRLDHGDTIQLGDTPITVLQTPGHSPGGLCFYNAPHLITGDTLFVDGCGRCNFETSNIEDMATSLFDTIWALPDDTIIYPGHAYGHALNDTLGNQKLVNRFLRVSDKKTFMRLRMGL